MVKCHLSTLMGQRKLKISDVAGATGLHRNTVTLLYKETAKRIDFDDLEKLCRHFEVTVGELLEVVPTHPETEVPLRAP